MPVVPDYSKLPVYEDMRRLLINKTNPLIFDVGANVGQSIGEFKDNFPESIIYSFEPSPSTFLQLKKNHTGKPDIFLQNVGLGAVAGKKEFLENESSEMSSFLEYDQMEWGKFKEKTIVDLSTLDEYCRQNYITKIDVLKMDTQGYELEVLKGAVNMLKEKNIQLLFFEVIFSDMYKNLPAFGDIHKLLSDNNYKVVKFYDSHCVNDLLCWIDVLYINPDFQPSRK